MKQKRSFASLSATYPCFFTLFHNRFLEFTAKKGFTLIELLVVVLIIGILAAIAIPQYEMAVEKSRYAAILPFVKELSEAHKRCGLAGITDCNIDNLDVTFSRFDGQLLKDSDIPSGGSSNVFITQHFFISKDSQAYIISRAPYAGTFFYRFLLYRDSGYCSAQGNTSHPGGIKVLKVLGLNPASGSGWVSAKCW